VKETENQSNFTHTHKTV